MEFCWAAALEAFHAVEIALSAIDRLEIDTRAGSRVMQLSGGNQQKVTIARWLATGFTTLLCFDPTRGIDVGAKAEIYGLMRELAQRGIVQVLASTDPFELATVCDRVLSFTTGESVRRSSRRGWMPTRSWR